MNIFEKATRKKLRFPSAKGELTVEQLWDLPLRAGKVSTHSGAKADLDSVAREVNRQLKDTGEESFVDASPRPEQERLRLMLDLVKHIIAVKQAKEKDAEERASNAQRRAKLTQILAMKQDQALMDMSEDEIRAELAKD